MSYKKLDLHKMNPKDLTDKNLWDGEWLETKYPDKFKKKRDDTKGQKTGRIC